MDKKMFTESLLNWYDTNQRVLPWRENKDPYRVWISEIMLQQTRVETVIPYFNRFINKIPTVEALSKVDDDELNKLWEGLGYYSRARNLKFASIQVMNEFNGIIPSTQKELESLKGIGPYTSGAVLSISFDKPFTAVDGNVLRVFSRLYAIDSNIKDPKTKKDIKGIVEELLPKFRVGDFNQALMEIGATICVPTGRPLCEKCPLASQCEAKKRNIQTILPIIEKRNSRRKQDVTYIILKANDKYALRKRPPKGLLAGLYEFLNFDNKLSLNEVKAMYDFKSIEKLPSKKHIFTHIEWNITAYLVELHEVIEPFIWASRDELDTVYPIPVAFKKAFKKET